jgi:hypothetical protein
VEELLPAAALEILEGDELLKVNAHTQECAECARQLESYREAVAGVASTLPARPLHPARSTQVRSRLLARAGSRRSIPVRHPTWVRRAAASVDRWAGWGVAAGLAGVLMVHHSVHRPIAYGWLVAGALMLVVLVLGVYLSVQRSRLSALEQRLSSLMRRDSAIEAGPPTADTIGQPGTRQDS